MPQLEPAFFIQNIPVYGRLILAPMDGISDLPFRSLCRQYGSAMSYSSFVGAIEILQGQARAWRELEFLPEERPVALQISDNNVGRLVEAAKIISSLNPDIIDINMGCSVGRVSGRGAGAGLLKNPSQIAVIMSTLSNEMGSPITAKIRIGWDHTSLNYLVVAKSIEDSGGSLISVHARTREQAFGGSADWDAIAEIKQAVNIPVIGNGDIEAVEDIDRMLDHTSCDGVMIGRGAMGNPWIFQRRDRTDISMHEVADVISLHLKSMLNFYGVKKGIVLFRKHLVRYLQPMRINESTRRKLLTCNQITSLKDLMSEIDLQLSDIEAQMSEVVL